MLLLLVALAVVLTVAAYRFGHASGLLKAAAWVNEDRREHVLDGFAGSSS
jgi:hypothetical protein